jgi:hypothetical protein
LEDQRSTELSPIERRGVVFTDCVPVVLALLDRVATDEVFYDVQVAVALHTAARSGDLAEQQAAQANAIGDAFGYRLRLPSQRGPRDPAWVAEEHVDENGRVWPAPLDAVGEDSLDLWSDAAAKVTASPASGSNHAIYSY